MDLKRALERFKEVSAETGLKCLVRLDASKIEEFWADLAGSDYLKPSSPVRVVFMADEDETLLDRPAADSRQPDAEELAPGGGGRCMECGAEGARCDPCFNALVTGPPLPPREEQP